MGKKWRSALCMAVIALCLPAIVWTARRLPVQTRPLIEKKYAGWSGVLRIWVYEGWTDGDSFAGWLNRCAAIFEKRHGGVYIEARYVDPAALVSLETSGVRPPDMILFPPGVLDSAEGLALVDDSAVRPALRGLGGGYAVPVALGGYGWAVNVEAEGASIPPDEDWRSWSRAAAALGAPVEPEAELELTPPGIDLGLPAVSAMEEITVQADALTQFINGNLGAVAVTQRELARLTRLSDQGRGPEWTFLPGQGAYTDQVLYLAVLAGDEEVEALSKEFALCLLADESQSLLAKWGAFPTTAADSGAAGSLYRMDQRLRQDGLTVAPAFG